MKTDYSNAINVLVKAFPEIENIYNNDIDEYVDLPYALYEGKFVPFIMKQLQEKNTEALRRIFDFIERLFEDGDEMIINLAEVAIVESLFFEMEYELYAKEISGFCGKMTRQSFDEYVK